MTVQVHTGVCPDGMDAHPQPHLTQLEVSELAKKLVHEGATFFTSNDLMFTAARLYAARAGVPLDLHFSGKVIHMHANGQMSEWPTGCFDRGQHMYQGLADLRRKVKS